jgi:hypothetical protein
LGGVIEQKIVIIVSIAAIVFVLLQQIGLIPRIGGIQYWGNE